MLKFALILLSAFGIINASSIAPIVFAAGQLQQPTIVYEDATWDLYKNPEEGFMMKIPKKIWGEAYCSQSGTPPFMVPVDAFDDGNGKVYIGTAYSYESSSANSECLRVPHSVAYYLNPHDWHYLRIDLNKNIQNKDDLTKFIRAHYGSGCSVGSMVPATQDGTLFNVKVQADVKSSEQTHCAIDDSYVVFYSPQKHKAATWDLGQHARFTDKTANMGYDSDMVNSFRFF